ncbi:MAG: TVP38/TMEM64 family protein [Clostridia bacterium]|nr:TVP38/TMEM64 family protein [Clostridia bacterium]
MAELLKKGSKNRMVTFAGLILLAFGLLLIVVMSLRKYHAMWVWYDNLLLKLDQLKNYILHIPQPWKVALMILLLYVIKFFIPIYPTSTVCFFAGLMFPTYIAIPLSILGTSLMYTYKYFWGYFVGGGMAWKMVNKVNGARKLLLQDGSGNPWLLVMLCVIPGIPVNTVSSLYGSMNFGYRKFLLLSTLGFLPRLVSYTIVGRNAFDPLSIGFLLPLTIICILSAITLLSTNGVIMFVEHIVKKTKNSKKEKES